MAQRTQGVPLSRTRRVATAATASLPVAGALFALLLSATASQAQSTSAACEEATQIAVLPAPFAPCKGAPLRVIVASEKPLDGQLSLIAPDGSVAAKSHDHHDGPPYFLFAEVASPAGGTWHASLALGRAPAGCGTISHDIVVREEPAPPPRPVAGSLWPLRNSWNRETENLYSAWI